MPIQEIIAIKTRLFQYLQCQAASNVISCMDWNRNRLPRHRVAKYQMADALPVMHVTMRLEKSEQFRRPDGRKPAHAGANRATRST